MFKGMNTEDGLRSSVVIGGKADELAGDIVVLTRAIHEFEWKGTDADRTRESWDNQQARDLQNVVEALRGYSRLIKEQAEAQRQVSS